jgi:branched-chain amino acid transport system substrate-binding protein
MRVTSRCAPTRAKTVVNTGRVGFSALAAATALVTATSLSAVSADAEDIQTVAIGAILPITGLASTLGPVERDALNMAVEEINSSGGFEVAGKHYKLALKVLDDETNPAAVGVSGFRQLVDVDKVPVLIDAVGARSYQALIRRSPLPVLNILDSVAPPSILTVDPHVFLLRTDVFGYVPGGVWYLKNVLHKERIAFIGSAVDPYSASIENLVKGAAESYGAKIVADVNYPGGATDFSPFIQSATNANADAIYLGGVTQEVLPVAKQLYQSGVRNIPIAHSSGATPTQAKQIIGDPLYNDVMVNNYDFAGTLPELSNNPATKKFFNDFLARYHEYPDDLTMWAYDTPFIIVGAMQAANSVSDREKIYQAMLQMKIPPKTISEWVPAEGGKLFHDRNAQTLSEGVGWCPDKKTIAAVFVYRLDGYKLPENKVIENGCKGR